MIVGAGGFYMAIDVSTQFAEHKLMKARHVDTTNSRHCPTTASDTDVDGKSYSVGSDTTIDDRPTKFTLVLPRTLRMGVIGLAQGFFSIFYFVLVNKKMS